MILVNLLYLFILLLFSLTVFSQSFGLLCGTQLSSSSTGNMQIVSNFNYSLQSVGKMLSVILGCFSSSHVPEDTFHHVFYEFQMFDFDSVIKATYKLSYIQQLQWNTEI